MQLVAVSITKMFLFVSHDGGRMWTRYSLPSSRFDPTNNLYLSRKSPRHMVLLTDNGKVRGEKWEGGGGEGGEVGGKQDDVKPYCGILSYHTAVRLRQ